MLGAIAQWAPDLIRRDPKRIFSSEERAAIYYRDEGVCQEAGCGVAVKFTDFHADHVIPWVHGGATKLANAQLLCAPHNLTKGANAGTPNQKLFLKLPFLVKTFVVRPTCDFSKKCSQLMPQSKRTYRYSRTSSRIAKISSPYISSLFSPIPGTFASSSSSVGMC